MTRFEPRRLLVATVIALVGAVGAVSCMPGDPATIESDASPDPDTAQGSTSSLRAATTDDLPTDPHRASSSDEPDEPDEPDDPDEQDEAAEPVVVRQHPDEPQPQDGPPIEDPNNSMARFYDALAQTESKQDGAITRVLHMGDSSIGLDGLPHAIRKRMMQRFGDAGPGFVLFQRRSKNYLSHVAKVEGDGWHICYIAYLCRPDGHYGLGGHVFRTRPGAWSKIASAKQGRWGHIVSRIELWFADQPNGGRLRARVDRGPWQEFDTRANGIEDRWHTFEVEPGRHRLEVRSGGHGSARAYGAVLENDGPGVVWDTASMIGAFTKRLHGYDDRHIAAQIEHRDPDLLVLNYGGNDLRRIALDRLDPADYVEEYRVVLRKLLGPRPDHRRSCLVVSVIDHGRSGRQKVRPGSVDSMVAAQRQVAFEEGCAFFDSVAAMGGAGAIRKWLDHKPRLAEPDLKHLNRRGRDLMGDMMYRAMMAGYEGVGTQ